MSDSTRIPGRRLLHSPGPTPLPDAVLDAMSRQPMDLADPRVSANIDACEHGLRRLLHSRDAKVFFYASNGHGVWEAVIENLLPIGGTALVPGTGHFSESWAVQTEALGRRVVRTPWREDHPIDVEALVQALRDDREHAIAAVFVVHTDTASSVTTDLAALRAAIDSTGSIGRSTLDVIAQNRDRFSVVALAAGSNIDLFEEQIRTFRPGLAAVAGKEPALALRERLQGVEILYGADGVNSVAACPDADFVLSPIVGSAGLLPTITAIKAGKTVGLANKETLVMAGDIVRKEAKRN